MKLIFSLALAVATTPALAVDGSEGAPTRHVRVSDLNITTPAGIAALDRRINVAARAICDSPDQSDLRAKIAYRQCVAATRQAAQPQRDRLIAEAQRQQAFIALNR